MSLPPLPPGFVMEGAAPAAGPAPRAPSAAMPPLPAGFELDDEQAPLEIDIVGGTPVSAAEFEATVPAAAPAADTSWLQTQLRGLGLGARSVLQGGGSLLGALGGDAFNAYVVDPLRRAVHTPTMDDLVTGDTGPAPSPSYRDALGGLADTLGLPQPQDGRERVLGDVGEALTGTALTLGAGGLANMGSKTLAPLGEFLTAQPALQTVSTVTGSGAMGMTREGGGGEGAQLLAALGGGLAPGAASGIPMALRGAFRGGEANRVALGEAIDDFGSVGAMPTVGQGTDSWMRQGVESLLAGGPTSGGVMRRAAERQAEDIGEGVRQVANRLSPDASSVKAGEQLKRGIVGEGGFKERTRTVQGQLYDQLDAQIDPQARVAVENAQRTLPAINPEIPGAPALTPMFQNSRIQGIEDALKRDTSSVAAVATRPGMADEIAAARKTLQERAKEIEDWNAAEAADLEKINLHRRSMGQREVAANPYPVTSNADIDDQVAEMLKLKVDGKLPYEALKKLRTAVGQEIENAGLMSDVPRSKWKALYGALAQDMRVAAEEAGPDAMRAFTRANNYTRSMIERMERISHVVDAKGGPEKVFRAAMAGSREGGTTVRAVMQSLDKDAQRSLTAAVIKRMGMANPSVQDAAGDVFSAGTFLTNWNKVSPEARRALFDRHGAGFSADMDKIARVAQRIKEGSEVFRNPSGTANRAAAIAYPATIGGLVVTGQVGPAALTIGGGAVANGFARAMTNPRFVKWLARSTDMPIGALPAQINVLKRMAEENDDPAVAEIADALAAASEAPEQPEQ